MKSLLGRPHAGAAAQILLEQYFLFQQVCGVIALVHLLGEWLYMGKPLQKFVLGLLLGLLALGLVGGKWLQPKLKGLHRQMFVTGAHSYVREPTTAQQKAAEKSFKIWHGIAQGLNFIYLVGSLVYLWHIADSAGTPRFFSFNKFRG